ncbi:MAG: rhomboid family intramembrane serine protease [Spirochaetes bacterium]|nr:rhomboid family intramembrane serine protease [Spirochaetota bacterium]
MNGTGSYTKSWVIRLIVLNIAIFFGLQLMLSMVSTTDKTSSLGDVLTFYLGLRPILVIEKFYIWQLFTYMFLHGGFLHIFLNMYALLIFGIPVEQAWGSRRFLFYYLFTGIGAGITILVINTVLGGVNYITPTIGASGAVFGLLLAFGMLFPDAEILLFFIIPMRAKFLVLLYGGIELYSLIGTGGQSPISHAGHLGGIIFGLLFFLILRKRGLGFKSKILKARFNREHIRREKNLDKDTKQPDLVLETILQKLKTKGPGSITDDEYQHIRYMDIMTQDINELCVEEDFDQSDEYCSKCVHRDACLIRQIKNYL